MRKKLEEINDKITKFFADNIRTIKFEIRPKYLTIIDMTNNMIINFQAIKLMQEEIQGQ